MKRLYIGTSGWTYDHWKGDFYPSGLPVSEWFAYYDSIFNAVEVNATFYRHFQDTIFLNWYRKAPKDFCFVLKVPKIITHRKYLQDCFEEIQEFARQALLLKEKLGCLLIQLPPGLKYEKKLLGSALDAFPKEIRLAVEFRHQSWYEQDTAEFLYHRGIAFVNTDFPGKTVDYRLKTAFPYLRFHGRIKWYSSDYSDEVLREVAEYFAGMSADGERPGFAFFNNDFGGFAPKNAIRLKELVQELQSE